MKIERIFLSTDCSEFSSGAEREAINLAKRFSTGLFIHSTIETNPEFTDLAPQIRIKKEKMFVAYEKTQEVR